MSEYQSFPGRPGSSQSEAKLRSLFLPDLAGRSFLDVGCNEGFFCGFALHAGASSVVGIDRSASAIRMARSRFPAARFLCQSWDTLPPERFDRILCASSLHYADDQPSLIHRMMTQLDPGGVLVLEIGVHPSAGNAMVAVRRAIDTREFMTWDRVHDVLSPYAWKGIGASTTQAGDPIARHVIHVTHRLPTAYLLTSVPNSGKSTVARTLFGPSDVAILEGDLLIQEMASNPELSPDIFAAIHDDFDPLSIDSTIDAICRDRRLLETYADHVVELGAHADFAYDGYLPEAGRELLVELLRARGYWTVKIDVPPGQAAARPRAATEAIDAFVTEFGPSTPLAHRSWAFCIDSATVGDAGLLIHGWVAPDEANRQPALTVRYNGQALAVLHAESVRRPDVARHLDIENEDLGFTLLVESPASAPAAVDFYATDAEGNEALLGTMFT